MLTIKIKAIAQDKHKTQKIWAIENSTAFLNCLIGSRGLFEDDSFPRDIWFTISYQNLQHIEYKVNLTQNIKIETNMSQVFPILKRDEYGNKVVGVNDSELEVYRNNLEKIKETLISIKNFISSVTPWYSLKEPLLRCHISYSV